MWGEARWRVNDQRHAASGLKEVHLVPEAALTEHVPVIRQDQGDGVVGKPCLTQGLKKNPELLIDVGNGTVIGMARRPYLRCRDRGAFEADDVPQAEGMRILGRRADARHV